MHGSGLTADCLAALPWLSMVGLMVAILQWSFVAKIYRLSWPRVWTLTKGFVLFVVLGYIAFVFFQLGLFRPFKFGSTPYASRTVAIIFASLYVASRLSTMFRQGE
jgi:glucan phosphoethanolaminetransferase (alkaline phosphatase superfamily)